VRASCSPRVVLIAVLLGVLCRPVTDAAATGPAARDRIWFVPNPGTLDLIRMFEHPEEWPQARELMDVFQFTQQHTLMPADRIVGPNSYEALARAGVFSTLVKWHKHIAIGVGAVKEFYCTPDDTGMAAAIADAERAIRAVTAAGGQVTYLAMDDPFAAGQAKVCGGPDLIPTADRIQRFVSTIRREFPQVYVGQIDAYPFLSPDQFEQMLDLLAARDAVPAFLQIDVDIRAVKPPRNFTNDLRRLRQLTSRAGVPMGIIVWGYNGDADALFARDAYLLANAFRTAFPTWKDTPEQISVQSWSPSSTGVLITPSNLPESRPYTLTQILLELYREFRGATGPPAGIAIPR
jgi:hypothetical protein